MEMISMPSIIVIVYAIISLLRLVFKKFASFENFVPLISGILGTILSIIAFYAVPTIVPTDNVFHALLGGLFSGLSATGSEQLVKQIKEFAVQTKQNKIDKKA